MLLALAAAAAALLPLASAKVWSAGWEVTGSVCQNQPPSFTCSTLCSTWTQTSDNQCVAGAAGSQLAGVWSSLDVLADNEANFTLYSDAACAQPIQACSFVGVLDGTCKYVAMSCGFNSAQQTQYNYRFKLDKKLPAYIVVLIIVFGGVLPLLLILIACYCCCCRGSAKTRDADIEAQKAHIYASDGARHQQQQQQQQQPYTREQLRELEHAQRHPQQLTLEQIREREFAERQRQQRHQQQHAAGHGAPGHAPGHGMAHR
jgi:hypothetical protein